ncbi:MAG TPA: serine protease [Mesorhizobium sp.]|jgi:V8-like Glu-specific endopeptidase|nr:serine protease [Mesorhizobium sp.]
MKAQIAWAAAAAFVLTTALPPQVLAQEPGQARVGTGAAQRSTEGGGSLRPRAAAPAALKTVKGVSRASPRAAGPEALVKGLSAVSRSREGKQTVTPPSEALRRIVEEGDAAPGDGAKTLKPRADGAGAPEEEATRHVFGRDDRVQINGTTNYPFSAIGYLEAKTASGTWFTCSAALIGPRTVLTAAQCLFNHDDGGWMDEFVFYPGMKSFDEVPYGGYPYDTVTVQQAYIDDYLGAYDDVLTRDLGVVTLQEPVGDDLGWLGYGHYDGLGDFSGHLVAYPGDKPNGTMWRASCDVLAEDVDHDWLAHDCDATVGTSGGAFYAFDGSDRIVLGVQVAEDDTANYAVRLNRANVEWIDGLWQ